MSDEAQVADFSARFEPVLSNESNEIVKHYLRHDECELALEALLLDLIAQEVQVDPQAFESMLGLAERMGLAEDSVLDGDLWPKLIAWGKTHRAS